MADHVPLDDGRWTTDDRRRTIEQRRNRLGLWHCFLDPVFAEDAQPRLIRGDHHRGRMQLAHCDQRDLGRIAASALRRGGDARLNCGDAFGKG